MKITDRLNIQARLGLGYALLTLLVMLVALMAIRALGSSQQNFENQVQQMEHLQDLGNGVLSAANSRAIAARNLVLSADPTQAASELSTIQSSHARVQARLKALREAVTGAASSTPELRQLLEKIEQTEAAYGPVALNITQLATSGQREQAILHINKDCRPLLATLIQNLDLLLKETDRISKANVERSQADFSTLRLSLLGLGALAVLAAVVLGVLTTRSIVRPLAVATAASEEFAHGDLAHALTVQGHDEIAHMLGAMEDMRRNIAGIVTQVRKGADGVATASVQIAQGNQDLSGRTESQASSLQQAASSMEQLNATVRQNADNAQQANEMARTASQVASAGGQVVTQVVDTMRGINESSRRIADIIGVIDSIAFQTNILALNAAVEAARAGEQGRGFAVVAGEVRALAQRSAEAAREIKTLINDSVERVEQGSRLADQAGNTMQQIVSGIQRVTDIVSEISSASHEQSRGVSQVSAAVSQMDHATQQNAALVEEMAAAANSMSSQAQQLVKAVAVFRVEDSLLPIQAGAR